MSMFPFSRPIRAASLGLGLAFAAQAVAAEDASSGPWYLGLDVSAQWFADTDMSGQGKGRISYDPGLSLSGLRLGYLLPSSEGARHAFRGELELVGRVARIDEITGAAARDADELDVGALMLNALVDFRPEARISPYLGAGLGVAAASFSDSPGFGIVDKDSADTVAAVQAMAGVSFRPEGWTRTRLHAGYRYFATEDFHFKTKGRDATLDRMSSHELTAGVTFHF